MATQLNPVDILLVGYGWTGGIIAKELASTGLKILALERGGPRGTDPDFIDPERADELRYAIRHELMMDTSRETLTFRNNATIPSRDCCIAWRVRAGKASSGFRARS